MNTLFVADGGVIAAHVRLPDIDLHLVKASAMINFCGPALSDYCVRSDIAVEDLIVVQDDVSMSLGAVRARVHGGDGGHKGMRSVLTAMRTDQVRRVKVGVGSPGENVDMKEFVLRPIMGEEKTRIDAACDTAIQFALAGLHRALEKHGIRTAPAAWHNAASPHWIELERSSWNDDHGTMCALATRFLAEIVPRRNPTSRGACERRIPEIVERFGTSPIDAVGEPEIVEFLHGRCLEDALEIRMVLSQMFKSGLRWGWASRNPAAKSA